MFQAKIWHWHTTRRCFGKVCTLGYSEKVCIFSPFLRLCQKPQVGGGRRKDLISMTTTLCWYFLFISLLHEDRFFGFVLVTRWVQMHNIHRRIMFLLVTRNFLPLCPVRPQDLWRWSLGWICQCPSVGGGALPRHPCRLCWEEMWKGSGCHHVFVKQNPSSFTTGPALQGQRSWATLAPLSLACSVDLRKSSCYTVLLLTLRQRIAVRLQLSGLVYPDLLVNSSCNSSESGSVWPKWTGRKIPLIASSVGST